MKSRAAPPRFLETIDFYLANGSRDARVYVDDCLRGCRDVISVSVRSELKLGRSRGALQNSSYDLVITVDNCNNMKRSRDRERERER